MESKSQLRDEYRLKLRSKVAMTEDLRQKTLSLKANLKHVLSTLESPLGGYRELPGEPPLELFLDLTPSKWCFPKRTSEKALTYHSPEGWSFASGCLWEPVSSTEVALTQIKALVIPGLAFDRRGFRLGYGQGYFDRTLAQFKGLSIGVSWDDHIHPRDLPTDVFDRKLNMIVTPSCLWDLRS